MFFGLEWLIITNIVYPLGLATAIALAPKTESDKLPGGNNINEVKARHERNYEMKKIRARRAAVAAEKAAKAAASTR